MTLARSKRRAESILHRTGLARLVGRLRRGDALVLAYHNIVPEGASRGGERTLHLPQADFARQLDLLVRVAEVVPLEQLLIAEPSGSRPRAALTFDDAYRGSLTAGLEELAKRNLPATIFVAPGCLGATFWWDELAQSTGGSLDQTSRENLLTRLAGAAAEIRREYARADAVLPSHASAATEAELVHASFQSGITLGVHSWSHPNLTALEPARLEDEVGRSLAWLQGRFSRTLPLLAYPYGRTSDAVERATRDAGYRAAFLIAGGWIRYPLRGPYRLPRLNVPAGISLDGFALRVHGLLGR